VDIPVRCGGAHDWRELLGESFCLYLPGMDDGCLEIFLDKLSKTYPDHHLLVVLDGAPSHRSEQITHPENISLIISLIKLPPYSPELAQNVRKVVPGVQTRVVQQDLRNSRPTARSAHPDACALLGRPGPPQTAHRLLLVGEGR
jgi:hypothetical protein